MLLSSAFRGDEAGAPLLHNPNVFSDTEKLPKIATQPLEVELADCGTFDLEESVIRFSAHVIRLEDYRVICIHYSNSSDLFLSISLYPGGDKTLNGRKFLFTVIQTLLEASQRPLLLD